MDPNCMPCLTQHCYAGIPIQRHRRVGMVIFHPNFPKSNLDTPSGSISCDGMAVLNLNSTTAYGFCVEVGAFKRKWRPLLHYLPWHPTSATGTTFLLVAPLSHGWVEGAIGYTTFNWTCSDSDVSKWSKSLGDMQPPGAGNTFHFLREVGNIGGWGEGEALVISWKYTVIHLPTPVYKLCYIVPGVSSIFVVLLLSKQNQWSNVQMLHTAIVKSQPSKVSHTYIRMLKHQL